MFHILGIVAVLGCALWMGRRRPASLFLSRKLLHIGAIAIVSHAVFSCNPEQISALTVLVAMAACLLTFAVYRGFFQIDGRKSWGIAYFPWALCLLLGFQPLHKETIALAFFILALSDGISAIAGRYIKLPAQNQTINGKTWLGFFVFTMSTWIILMVFYKDQWLLKNDGWDIDVFLGGFFLISLTAAIIELLSPNGTDNLWIPLWLFYVLNNLAPVQLLSVNSWEYLPFVVLLGYAVWRRKWLSTDGLLTAYLLAFVVLLAQLDLKPLVLFFFLGSLASKLNKEAQSDKKQGKPRDAWQVLANGGWVAILALSAPFLSQWFGKGDLEFLVIVLMSAALGDTLSSDVGMRFGGIPRSILTFKPVPKGVSGGITVAGLGGAFLGGLIMVGYTVVSQGYITWKGGLDLAALKDTNNGFIYSFILFSGFGGSLIDSMLGEWIQEKFERQGILSDVGEPKERVKGIKGITNDGVNFLSMGIWLAITLLWVFMFFSYGN